MRGLASRLFRVEAGEWSKLLQFGLFGLLLQTGMGVGFAAGDAAFLTKVGADKLPVIFLLTPVVMLVYTAVFSYLLVRFSIDRVVEVTLGLLIFGGALLWGLMELGLPAPWNTGLYYALKLYLAVWYIGLYSLFWNFTDSYFDIQDAKRLFPLFAAFCALGTTLGALIVSVLANVLPMHGFMLVWSGLALATAPVALMLRRRWPRIADSDADLDEGSHGVRDQARMVAEVFRTSPYAVALVGTLFVTLLMTNLAEYQYSLVLQEGRSEAELAALFGQLYAAASAFNLVVCLFVFNRLVTRMGVRNVALILPLTYFAVFAVFFLVGGELAALGAFFAYHGVLTSIEYNNQNLLFNATPSHVKRPFRTVVEGLCEPLASLLSGAFLLLLAKHVDMRELSGIGVLLGAALVGVVMLLRHTYPAAMEANMRRGWLNFGELAQSTPEFDEAARAALQARVDAAESGAEESGAARAAQALLDIREGGPPPGPSGNAGDGEPAEVFAAGLADPSPSVRKSALEALSARVGVGDIGLVGPLVAGLDNLDQEDRRTVLNMLATIGDVDAIPQILPAVAQLTPRELRAAEAMLVGMGEAAAPRLIQAMANDQAPYRARAVAARALCVLSHAQFLTQLDRLVGAELDDTVRRQGLAERFAAQAGRSPALGLLAEAARQRIAEAVDFVLELLALGGRLPDFDLLIVSLHSANPKVRGNAIEAIAAGVDHPTWRRLEPLLHRGRESVKAADAGDLIADLARAAATSQGFDAVVAAQALRDLAPPEALAALARGAVEPGLAPIYRESLVRILAGGDDEPTLVDLVGAIRARPDLSAASIDAQAALARRVVREKPAGASLELVLADGRSRWLSTSVVEEVAARRPDLALAVLKAGDGRAYAA
ncbi:hypothetical protein [Phenylobacterium sp.]|uniref:hypothetical protein n=1 Tax=Phenylobacterium sp. TaxID=1871053 RepID=UPI00301DF959